MKQRLIRKHSTKYYHNIFHNKFNENQLIDIKAHFSSLHSYSKPKIGPIYPTSFTKTKLNYSKIP